MSQSQRRGGPRADMVPEIAAAVGFVSSLLRTRGCVSERQLQVFSGALREALAGEAQPRGPGKRSALQGGRSGARKAHSCPSSCSPPRGRVPTGVLPRCPPCCSQDLVSFPGCPPVSSWVGHPSVSFLDTQLCHP